MKKFQYKISNKNLKLANPELNRIIHHGHNIKDFPLCSILETTFLLLKYSTNWKKGPFKVALKRVFSEILKFLGENLSWCSVSVEFLPGLWGFIKMDLQTALFEKIYMNGKFYLSEYSTNIPRKKTISTLIRKLCKFR